MTEAEGDTPAWRLLRGLRAYRTAYETHAAAPAFEEGAPFPVRIQSQTDLRAAAWRLLAWEHPARGDAQSPFWIGAPTLEGALKAGAPALAALAGEPGAAVEGLRLLDGALVLKISCGPAVVRIRLRDRGRFPRDGAVEVMHDFGLRMPQPAASLYDFWTVAGEPVPSRGRAQGRRTGSC